MENLALGAVFTTLVGLVVWLVKTAQRRQDATVTRTLNFMEEQVRTQAEIHTKHAEANGKLADAIQANTDQLRGVVSHLANCPGASLREKSKT